MKKRLSRYEKESSISANCDHIYNPMHARCGTKNKDTARLSQNVRDPYVSFIILRN